MHIYVIFYQIPIMYQLPLLLTPTLMRYVFYCSSVTNFNEWLINVALLYSVTKQSLYFEFK